SLYDKGLKLIEISSQLNVPEGTVRSWKNRYHWDCNVAKEKCNVAKKRGGQPKNKNAVGNTGGAAPPENKNAVKTGEFETLFFDCLEPDEQKLIQAVQPDKEQLLLQEIQLLTVRERRMLKRIESLKLLEQTSDPEDDQGEDELEKAPPGMSVTKYKSGMEKGKPTLLREYEGILGQIQSIEDALTRVQARRQRAIEALHKFGYDDAHLELETMKFELELLKQDGQNEDNTDDGFLEAMNASDENVWGDEDV
ncbi:MAG: phage terminase small subunit, partial [Blautia faecis]